MRSLFGIELKKNICSHKLYVFMVIVLSFFSFLFFMPRNEDNNFNEEIYKQYTIYFEGEITADKLEEVQNKSMNNYLLISKYDEKKDDYINGLLSIDSYKEYLNNYNIAIAEIETIDYIRKKMEQLYDMSAFDKYIFFDVDWSNLFNNKYYSYIILIFAIWLGISSWDYEFEGKRIYLLKTSKNYEKVLTIKMIIVSVEIFIFCIMMNVIRLVPLVLSGGIKYSGIHAGNLFVTEAYGAATLLGVYFVDCVIKSISFVLLGLIVSTIVVCVGNALMAYMLSATLAISIYGEGIIAPAEIEKYLLQEGIYSSVYGIDVNPIIYIVVAMLKILVVCYLFAFFSQRKKVN